MDKSIIESRNWILKKIKGSYKVKSFDYPHFYKNLFSRNRVPISGDGTLINWNKIAQNFSLNYEEESNKEHLKYWFDNSILKTYDNIIVEFGYNQPIVSVNTKIFIENWYDFAGYQGFVGITLFTEDCKLILEFTDRKKYLLYSNFPIQSSRNKLDT